MLQLLPWSVRGLLGTAALVNLHPKDGPPLQCPVIYLDCAIDIVGSKYGREEHLSIYGVTVG